jgi:signal transduction histidine kinase/CheY-like chemotaxis protein
VKKLLLFIGCLVALYPWTAWASPDPPLVSSTLVFSLVLVFLFAVGFGWLFQQLRKMTLLHRETLTQLQALRQMVDVAPWPMLLIDRQLRVVQCNREAITFLGQGNIQGRFFADIYPEEASHPLLQTLQWDADVEAGAENVQVNDPPTTLRLLHIDNQPFALWCGPPPLDNAEQTSATLISQAEESANRMKSEFIANINHEVRTPMNAIIGYTEMLANTALGPKEKRFVETIHKSSMALVSIFNDIMELSKIDSGRLQIMTSSIRIDTVLREIEGLFQDQAMEKGIGFDCRLEPHLPKAYILDGMRLKQVLQNLVSNAIKFTSEGHVQVIVDGSPSPKQSGRYDLRVLVEDTGIGIPGTDQRKIFQLFQQREDTIAKRYGGVGLGLTLCSRLVTMMGGSIELSSNVGEGSRFTVYLDAVALAEPSPVKQALNKRKGIHAASRSLTILVVDDIDLIKDVFIDFFSGGPHQVLTANTGEEALVLARREHPDLIFMDLNLSGMDGRAVTQQIREDESLATTPVVVMTGEVLEQEDFQPLFDDFLQKPFRLELLTEIVGRYAGSGGTIMPAPTREIGDTGPDDHDLARSLHGTWNEQLDQLLRQAVRSGGLADAVDLGAAIGKMGEMRQDEILISMGGDLLQFAAEPNIMGVDRLLAKLMRVVNRKES